MTNKAPEILLIRKEEGYPDYQCNKCKRIWSHGEEQIHAEGCLPEEGGYVAFDLAALTDHELLALYNVTYNEPEAVKLHKFVIKCLKERGHELIAW